VAAAHPPFALIVEPAGSPIVTGIDSRRHFTFLICAVLLLPVLVEPVVRTIPDLLMRTHVYFGLVGLLNAVTWVLALRGQAPAIRQVAFLAVATVLSTAAPYVGRVVGSMPLSSDEGILSVSALAAASAGGAATYWLAVRWFWLQRLAWSSLALAVVACVVATSSALLVDWLMRGFASLPETLRWDFPTFLWWFAFSASTLSGRGLPKAS
jgi:hypothetical protein